MNINEYTRRFFAVEKKFALFSEKENGIAWWDAVRFEVFYSVYDRLAGIERPPLEKQTKFKRIQGIVWRTFQRLVFFLRSRIFSYDVIVFRAPRKIINGLPVDESMDPILKLISGRKLVVNTSPSYFHRRQILVARDIIADATIRTIEGAFSEEFNLNIELKKNISLLVNDFNHQICFYENLFRRTNAKLILLTQNGIEKGMMVAANRLQIPIIEAQHGLISSVHPVYSYPENIDYGVIDTVPSHLFTYSEFWNRVSYIPSVQKVAIGKWKGNAENKSPHAQDSFDLLVISADKYDFVLRRISKRIAAKYPSKKIGYKLHPKQDPNEATIRKDLSECHNIFVLPSAIMINSLLPRVDSIITVQSTVVYEALQADRNVFIVAFGDYLIHHDIFHLAQVRIINVDDPLDNLFPFGNCSTLAEPAVFFDEFNQKKVQDFFASFLKKM